MDEEKKVAELLGQEIDVDQAIRIARIVANAPEERLPMILDVFEHAGLSIAGMDDIENLKELAKSSEQITGLYEFLTAVTRMTRPVNGEYRVLADVFDSMCQQCNQKNRILRRTLAEMGLIRINIENGRNAYTIPIYSTSAKKIARCVCIKEDWKKILGIQEEEHEVTEEPA